MKELATIAQFAHFARQRIQSTDEVRNTGLYDR
jgi:hypothetical protein